MTALKLLAELEISNKRIDELEKYNLDLASESFNKSNMIDYERVKNAELAAQVDRLMNAALDAFPLLNGSPEKVRLCGALRATPAQCLLEVKAEAGRAGFVEGFEASGEGYNGEYGATSAEIAIASDKYANKIRGGGGVSDDIRPTASRSNQRV